MRLPQVSAGTVAEVVNSYPPEEVADVFFEAQPNLVDIAEEFLTDSDFDVASFIGGMGFLYYALKLELSKQQY